MCSTERAEYASLYDGVTLMPSARTTKAIPLVTEKGLLIVSIAICGFANFSSVGMQIGGIGALAPERRSDLAKLGMRALISGTLASYLSATIAGMLI